MRYPASEKAESKADRRTIQWIVVPLNRLIEQAHLSVRRILEKLGIPRATFHRWVDLYQTGGSEALEDRPSRPSRVWNRIPDEIRAKVIALALEQPELSPRELAVRFTDEERHFVSEASVYRLLKAQDLHRQPGLPRHQGGRRVHRQGAADKAAVRGTDAPPSAPNQLWQTDLTYLRVTGWGWYYLSTVLDDLSRLVVAWKLCSTMQTSDATETLDLAPAVSGLDQ